MTRYIVLCFFGVAILIIARGFLIRRSKRIRIAEARAKRSRTINYVAAEIEKALHNPDSPFYAGPKTPPGNYEGFLAHADYLGATQNVQWYPDQALRWRAELCARTRAKQEDIERIENLRQEKPGQSSLAELAELRIKMAAAQMEAVKAIRSFESLRSSVKELGFSVRDGYKDYLTSR